MAADIIAKNLYPDRIIPHFVLAVKHPLKTAFQLRFEADALRVYASFPITRTRGSLAFRDEIDHFRKRLHKSYCVFDPLSVDDRVIKSKYNELVNLVASGKGVGTDDLEITQTDRWNPGFVFTTAEEGFEGSELLQSDGHDKYPLHIPVHQAAEVSDDIDEQIPLRDYRLLNQADTMAVYRPQLGGPTLGMARGVEEEMRYMRDTLKKAFVIYWPDEDGAPNGPFSISLYRSPYRKRTLQEFWEAIEEKQKDKRAGGVAVRFLCWY